MNKAIIIRTCRFVFILLLVFLVVSCSTKIDSLEKFENKHVTVEGKVLKQINYGSLKAFEFETNGKKLIVFDNGKLKSNSTMKLSGIIYKEPLVGYRLILDEDS